MASSRFTRIFPAIVALALPAGENLVADCQTTYPGQGCILYAVNDRVVFVPGGPY